MNISSLPSRHGFSFRNDCNSPSGNVPGVSRLKRRLAIALGITALVFAGTLSAPEGPGLTEASLPQAQALPTNSESAARAQFESVWDIADTVTPFSTGTVLSSCTPGTPQPEAQNKMLLAWNYLRSLNNLDPVVLPGSYAPQVPAQAAALTAAASPTASPMPDPASGFRCVTENAKLASRSGVIARLEGIVTPATEILRYVTEASPTNSNDNLGQRLEMFYPQQANAAIGAISIGTSGPTATSIQLFDSSYQDAGRPVSPSFWDENRYQPPQITWPSSGYFPTRLLPTGAGENVSRWSYSGKCADLTRATVSLSGPGGNIPIEVIRRNEPGVDPNLTPWEYGGYDTVLFKVPLEQLRIPLFYSTTTFKVNISNIATAPNCEPVPAQTSYEIELFNSSWPADPAGDADNDGIPNWQDSQPRIPDLNTSRIWGADRYETAAAIAKYPNVPPNVVYISRGDVLADALVGGVLKDGPVLLLPPEGTPVPPQVSATLETLHPKQVIALGGSGAVSDQRLYEFAQGRPALRLGGANRLDTSVMIARRAFSQADSLYLAGAYGPNGSVTPDALTGAALGDGPLVLVDSSVPAVNTIRQLASDLRVKRVVALGGESVVSTQVLNAVANGKPSTRLAGSNRYETSRLIAMEAVRLQPTNQAFLARGDVFADAVAGGHLKTGPILLVPPVCKGLDQDTLVTLGKLNAFQVTALGGSQVVCDLTLNSSLRWPDYVQDHVTAF